MLPNDQNFGLSETEFEHLKQKLQQGNEELTEIIYNAQIKSCCKFLMARFGASDIDALDTTMEILWQFRKGLLFDKVKYGNMSGLFKIMAKRWYANTQKKQKKTLSNALIEDDDEVLQHQIVLQDLEQSKIDADIWTDDLTQIIRVAFAKLNDKCRQLLNLYYVNKIPLEKLWETLSFPSYDAGKMQLMRCRKQFKIFFNDEFNR